MLQLRGIVALTVLGLLPVLAGCGEGKPAEYPVSGTVTYDGEPLADGNVYFKMKDQGEIRSFPISGGNFEGQAPAGNWRVEIVAFKEGPMVEPMPGEPAEPSQENYIPKRYNFESTLSAEVTAEGPNEYSWDLESGESGGN